jgi:hypothetical protein
LSLIEKVKYLDNFLNERYLEKEFTEIGFDYNGFKYDGSINTESYVQTFVHLDGSHDDVDMEFEKFQESRFKSDLVNLKKTILDDYISNYVSLAEKIAFATSLKQNLEAKLEKFRNNKVGRRYAPLFLEFINKFSTEHVEVIDSGSKNSSFYFLDRFSHRDTLNKLFSMLASLDLIPKETKQVDFLKLFDNKKVVNPITWLGNTSELKYFINLINRKDYGFEDKGVFKWRIAVKCFVKVSDRSMKKITFKDLRTYKITKQTKLKLDRLLLNEILSI